MLFEKNRDIFRARLKYQLDKNNLTQKEFASLMGVSQPIVSNWLNGTKLPYYDKVTKMSEIFNVEISYLMGEDYLHFKGIGGYKFDTVEEVGLEFNDYFPLHYSTNLSAGTLEELLNSEPDAVVYVPIKYQMMKKRLHAFKVNGTSMNNVIQDNSIVITEDISHLNSISDGTIVVALIDGEATVKRIYSNGNQVTLMPDSQDKSHMPINVNIEEKTIEIAGRVIWHMNPDDMGKYY